MKTKRGSSVVVAALGFFLCVPRQQAVAQSNKWEKTGLSQYISAILPDENNTVYAAGNGLYRSSDAGATWLKIETGISQQIVAFGIHPQGALFACAGSGVYRSSDQGNSWVQCFNGSSHPVFGVAFTPAGAIYVTNGNGGIHRSFNNGNTWERLPVGLSNRAHTVIDINFGITCVADTHIFGGIWEFFEGGDRWYLINGWMPYKNILALLVTPSMQILAGARNLGILSLPLNDFRVYQMNTGLQSIGITDLALAANGDILACSNETGIYRSTDDGKTWLQINRGLNTGSIVSIAVDQNYRLYAGTATDGLHRRLQTNTVAPMAAKLLSPANHALIPATSTQLQWQAVEGADFYRVQLAHDTTSNSFIVDQDNLADAYYDLPELVFDRNYYWRAGASNPEGTNWSGWWKFSLTKATTNNPLPVWPPNEATGISPAPTLRWNIVAGAVSYSLTVANYPELLAPSAWIISYTALGDTLFRALGLYPYRTYYWWVEANFANNTRKLLALPRKFTTGIAEPSDSWVIQVSGTSQPLHSVDFVDRNKGWVVGDSGTILHTSNGGLTWMRQNSDIVAQLRSVDFIDERNGFVVGGNGTILRTIDGGNTWINRQINAERLFSVYAASPDTVKVADSVKQIFQTFNGGVTWHSQMLPYAGMLSSMHFVNTKNGWFAGSSHGACVDCLFFKVFHTSDGGNNWVEKRSGQGGGSTSLFFINASQGWWTTAALRNERSSYPGHGGIAITSDAGASWQNQFSYSGVSFRSVHFTMPETGTAVGDAGVILHTSNGGRNWNLQSSGTTSDLKSVRFIDAQNGWVVGNNGLILHTTNGGDVAVEDPGADEHLREFSLYQNYPNPFNPVTSIEFSVARTSHVTLKVYNLNGEEIATLAAAEYTPGRHRVEWQAERMPSGVYFYRLQAESFIATQKMLLLR